MKIEAVGSWTIDDIEAVASHLEECVPKGCPGRYPEFNECTVADLCRGVLELVRRVEELELN